MTATAIFSADPYSGFGI